MEYSDAGVLGYEAFTGQRYPFLELRQDIRLAESNPNLRPQVTFGPTFMDLIFENVQWVDGEANEYGGRGGSARGQGHRSGIRADYSEVPRTHVLFEQYYDSLDLVGNEERDAFWAALRKELPNSFRFTGSKGQALPVQQLLKDRYIPEITSIKHNGELVDPPNAIPWFPNQLAWQMTTPKNIVRRFPPFASFQKFLVSETSVGNISRQEVVSMIPPLLMDIKPGMIVLDMCAAPGSKAAQLLEMVHGGEEARMQQFIRNVKKDNGCAVSPGVEMVIDEMRNETAMDGDWSDDGRATGLLIANDADYKRAHMLTHQMKRLNSPNLLVTNHDATMFPSIKLPSEPARANGKAVGKYLKFDRILADVPCSGDGTCRKNINIWKDWTPGNALGLFSTQVRILVRALQMLKVGGRVVYSTCSMNPVENEAVVASAIDRCGGLSKVEIIDCNAALPELRRKPGLNKWHVMDKQGRTWSSWGDVEEERAKSSEDGLKKLAESMFTPSETQEKIPFDRCLRLYPHLQDTGAFFITVLEKKTDIRARPEAESQRILTSQENEPQVSVMDAVNMVVARPSHGEDSVETSDTFDKTIQSQDSEVNVNPMAVASQSQTEDISPHIETRTGKRELDVNADAELAIKRPKLQEELEVATPQGCEDYSKPLLGQSDAQSAVNRPETTISDLPVHQANKKRSNQPFEEPFKYLDSNNAELLSIFEFYDLSPQFPRNRFMVRNAAGTPTKTIYYTSDLARSILTSNVSSGIKFVHCGVKMFVKQDVQSVEVCKWRIQSEGMPVLEGWVGKKRVVPLWRKSTLRNLLVEMFPKVNGNGWRQLGEIGERVRDIGMGCCLLTVEEGKGDDTFRYVRARYDMCACFDIGEIVNEMCDIVDRFQSDRMVLPLWRSLHSLNLMLPKEDRKAMLLRLYNDDTPLQDHSKERFIGRPKESDQNVKIGEPVEGNADEEVMLEIHDEANGAVESGVDSIGLPSEAKSDQSEHIQDEGSGQAKT